MVFDPGTSGLDVPLTPLEKQSRLSAQILVRDAATNLSILLTISLGFRVVGAVGCWGSPNTPRPQTPETPEVVIVIN